MKIRSFTLAALGIAAHLLAVAQPVATVSTAGDARAYRVDAARHRYASCKDQIYQGKLPPLVHAIVVVETEVDGSGQVRDVQMIRNAGPVPVPSRLGGSVTYLGVWLVDRSGRFQLDTLTEGQR